MKTYALRLLSVVGFAVGLVACDDPESSDDALPPEPGDPAFVRDPALDVENISEAGGQRSHNQGLNCMRCHQALGPGLGQFTVAGTVYGPDDEPAADAVLELRTAPERGGELIAMIEADAYGNVFSTEPLPLPEQRLFVWLSSADDSLSAAMPFPVSSGSCNHCHAGGFRVHLAEADGE